MIISLRKLKILSISIYPSKSFQKKIKTAKKKPWISNDLLKQINYKNKLHKKSQTEKDLNFRNDLINEVKVIQNSLREKIQFEKDYYQKFFKENKNNLIQVWKNIKSLINFKSKAKHNIKSLHIDKGKVTSDPIEICNHFNNHFRTIAGKFDKKIVKTG